MVPQTARSYRPNNNKAFVAFVFCLLSSSFATTMASTNVKRLRSLRQLEDIIALPADTPEDIIALPADTPEDIIALPADTPEDIIALPADTPEDIIAPADVDEAIIIAPADEETETCDVCIGILTTATASVEDGDRRKLPGDEYFAAIDVDIGEIFAFEVDDDEADDDEADDDEADDDEADDDEADDDGTEDGEEEPAWRSDFKKCKKACKNAAEAEGLSIIEDCAPLCKKVYKKEKTVKKACKSVTNCI